MKKGFSTIIVIIIGILILGGGTYFYTTSDNSNNEETQLDDANRWEIDDGNNYEPEFERVPTTDADLDDGHSGPSSLMTQSQAEYLVYKKWSDCSQGDCANVSVSFTADRGEQYLITAIFTEYSDSVSQTKREGLVIRSNESWVWSNYQPSPNEWRICHPGRGSQTFSTENCF